MSFWRQFLAWLGLGDEPTRSFEMQQTLVDQLQALAEREQLPVEDLTSDLLQDGLKQYDLRQETERCWASLSERQKQVARLIYIGLTNRQAADELYVSPDTIKSHMRVILFKFDLHSRSELRSRLREIDLGE